MFLLFFIRRIMVANVYFPAKACAILEALTWVKFSIHIQILILCNSQCTISRTIHTRICYPLFISQRSYRFNSFEEVDNLVKTVIAEGQEGALLSCIDAFSLFKEKAKSIWEARWHKYAQCTCFIAQQW